MNSSDIARLVLRHFREEGRMPIAPGVVLPHGFEADVAAILPKSGFLTEYEIKVSRGDYQADFAKRLPSLIQDEVALTKHEVMAGRLHGTERPMTTWHRSRGMSKRYWTPNYFYFVAPPGLLKVDEIPAHAGLMEVQFKAHSLQPYLAIIKTAPRLHKKGFADDVKVKDIFLRRLSNIAAFGGAHAERP